MANFLQGTQVEAHIGRLTNIKTQLQSYADRDGRAATAIPQIDGVIATLSSEPYTPDTEVVGAEVVDAVEDVMTHADAEAEKADGDAAADA